MCFYDQGNRFMRLRYICLLVVVMACCHPDDKINSFLSQSKEVYILDLNSVNGEVPFLNYDSRWFDSSVLKYSVVKVDPVVSTNLMSQIKNSRRCMLGTGLFVVNRHNSISYQDKAFLLFFKDSDNCRLALFGKKYAKESDVFFRVLYDLRYYSQRDYFSYKAGACRYSDEFYNSYQKLKLVWSETEQKVPLSCTSVDFRID